MVFYRQHLVTSIASEGAEGGGRLVSSQGHVAKDKGPRTHWCLCRGHLLSANISPEVWLFSRNCAKMLQLYTNLI